MTDSQIRLGIAGACGRGGSLFNALRGAIPELRVVAVCDVNAECLPDAKERLGAEYLYTDFDEMIADGRIDAVVIGTPMPFHASQAITSLDAGVHVLSEVPAAVSVDECREIVAACRRSNATYMMSENYIFSRQNVTVRALVDAGLFGTPYYAEGEYLHELKQLNEETPWRRTWQTGIAGVTYGTHSLGPILGWFPGERVTSVCAAGSGHHYVDPRGVAYENEDSSLMLCRMSGGGLVKVRVDMLSDRPHAMMNYQLQGTLGAYESARASGDRDRLWLRDADAEPRWDDLASRGEQYLPDWYARGAELASLTGHGGGDFFAVREFLTALLEARAPLVGIDEAMDMTLPGLASQQSAVELSRWVDVPDSRGW